jgi:hypothetical protein
VAKTCVSVGDACSGGTSTCAEDGHCGPCGAAGEACCGQSCNDGSCCDTSASASTCVAPGSQCAPGATSMVEVCSATDHICEICGGYFDPCCPGDVCSDSTPDSPMFCDSTGMCRDCGTVGEPCCPGATPCISSTCSAGTCS